MHKVILFLLLTSFSISAQVNRSIHQIENEYYSNNLQSAKSYVTSKTLQVRKSSGNQILNKTVFGFLPWWEYLAGSHQNIRYDLLSHIAISFFDSDGDGNLKDPPGWPWNDLKDSVKANHVKLMMTVSNFNSDQIHKLLTDQSSRQKLFNNISEKIFVNSFDGVNIDFENLLGGDEGSLIIGFTKSLNDFIKSKYPQAEISFDSPIINSGVWNFKGLAESCDYLFLMGYDFYGSWSNSTGPSSPLKGIYFSITQSLNNDYKNVPPEKLILGVPYYGNYWKTGSKDSYAKVTPYDSTKPNNNWVKPALRYKEIISQYASNEKMWDDLSQTPWLRWGQDTLWNQIWYDDENSLALKYDLAILKNLKGIGVWALGYDDGRTELWNLIEKKFVKTTSIDENVSNIPSYFELYQNYPNPFNPSTVIGYQLAVGSFVTLKVYDLLGREVTTLVNEYKQSGTYSVDFNIERRHQPRQDRVLTGASSLPSGVYFYTLSTGNPSAGPGRSFIQTKKMVILK